jgi:hypothetical protein
MVLVTSFQAGINLSLLMKFEFTICFVETILIPGYLSRKHSAFNTITQDDVIAVMDKINNRPHKCLGFKTPNEVYLPYNIAIAN